MADQTSAPLALRPSVDDVITQLAHSRASLELVFVDKRRVSCVGQGGALGHPKTFYEIGEKGYAECAYCDRIFYFDPSRAGEVITG
ncbi:MAG: zinc-finger domain-containing protein [Pseudomonadota bacterium]